MHRFFIADEALNSKNIAINNARVCHQIKTVLRFAPGEQISIFNKNGKEAIITLTAVSSRQCQGTLIKTLQNKEVRPSILVYCSILKRENFELVAQKITECGAHALIPIIADRTIKSKIKKERVSLIMQEAAEQCGRKDIPALYDTVLFTDALSHIAKKKETIIFFDAQGLPLKNAPLKFPVHLFIGPEGGWTTQEKQHAQQCGAQSISLGENVFRAETAAIVGTYEILRNKD